VHLVGFIIKKFNTEGFYMACRGWGCESATRN